jgi:hypothetical protein
MTRVQLLEREVRKLDRASLRVFRNWLEEYSAAAWDRQIARDSRSGKLKKVFAKDLAQYKAGKSRPL